jgi:S-(hydroxymethyl)glutathione dehydrogenase/alcohol dehydrogenase
MRTKAALLVQQNYPLEFAELEIPALKKGQVLVRIHFSGLCHSQLNEWKGIKGPDPYLPHTLGHEGSGIVLEIGEGVTKVKPGDHVVLSWIKGTGQDVSGAEYRWNNKMVHSGAISTFMEKAVISENRLIPIPKEFSLKEAALLGCAIPTGAGVVFNEMQLKAGQSIAIFGVGGVGACALLAASHVKAHPIIAIDVQDKKLERAQQMGATHVVHALKENPPQRIDAILNGQGVDFALECAGKKDVMEMAFESIRASGCCVLAGNIPKGEQIHIDPFELIKGKKIIGTWGGKSLIDHDVVRFADIFFKKPEALRLLISHEVPLSGINELMQALDQGKVGRGLIMLYTERDSKVSL